MSDLTPDDQNDTESKSLDLEETAAKWEQALEADADDVHALTQLSIAYTRMRRSDEAHTLAQRAIELEPNNAEAHAALGTELFLRDENDQAEDEFRRATELDPALPEPHFRMAQLLADRGDYDEAEKSLASGRASAGEDGAYLADGSYSEAYIHLARGDQQEAETLLERSLEFEDVNPRVAALAYGNLGTILARRGKYVPAIENLEKAVEIYPYLFSAHRLLGQLYLLRKRYPEALASLETAARYPRVVNGTLHHGLGVAYSKLGDTERSREHYREALKLGIPGPYALGARRALLWSQPVFRWIVYIGFGGLGAYLAITRLPTPTVIVLAALIAGFILFRQLSRRS